MMATSLFRRLLLLPGVTAIVLTASGDALGQHARHGSAPRAESRVVSESDYYRLVTIPIPEGLVLEVGGLALLPDDRLGVATRRGEIWVLQNPYMYGGVQPHYSRFAHGLHEPLGLAYRDGALYAVQRGELTRMRDEDGDGIADSYHTIHSWPQSGNHHAFSYGPKFLPDGRMWVTLGLDSPEGGITRHASLVPWRGWTALISEDGTFEPLATGLKQPAGFGLSADGEMFFAEHDDLWVASGYISHIEKGDFFGHPAGLRWKDLPGSPVKMKESHLDIENTGRPMYETAMEIPSMKLPAVWLPDGILGSATMDILTDTTGGAFGPFTEQLFVSDHTQDKLFRIFLEKVNGVYQGAAFPFREGLLMGLVRQTWGRDGSMFLGATNRGWAKGGEPYGLQRLVWTGKTPFEIKAIRAQPDGFELEFTRPADPASLNDPSLYSVRSFIYKYHKEYGSPVIHDRDCPILGVRASADGMKVRLVVDGLRQYYIHEIRMGAIADREGVPLLHDFGYYTLNEIPDGERLDPERMVRAEASQADEVSAERRPAETLGGHVTEMPAAWTEGPDVSLTIGTLPGLRFDLEAFEVPAGSRVRLAFQNEDDMLHNLVVVSPGAADAVGKQAMSMGLRGMEEDYVPETDQVLFHTELLQPGDSQTIYFTAPETAGDYPYVCTFPGHYISMRGLMKVLPRR